MSLLPAYEGDPSQSVPNRLPSDLSQAYQPQATSLPARRSSYSGPVPSAPFVPPPPAPSAPPLPTQAYSRVSPAYSLSSQLKPNSLPLPAALQNKTYVSPVGASAYGPPVASLNHGSPQPYPPYGSVAGPPGPSPPGLTSSDSPAYDPPIPVEESRDSPYYVSPYKPPKLERNDYGYASETVETAGATYRPASTQDSTALYQPNPYRPVPYETEQYPGASYLPLPHLTQDYSSSPYQHETRPTPRPPAQTTNISRPAARTTVTPRSVLETVIVSDGADSQSFTSAPEMGRYLRLFPEADNDQGCRMIKYGSQCATDLLMELFGHFEFSRYSSFPYGFAGDFSFNDSWGSGSCNCQQCLDGQLCGQFMLHKNLRFLAFQKTTPSSSTSPSISSATGQMLIDAGGR